MIYWAGVQEKKKKSNCRDKMKKFASSEKMAMDSIRAQGYLKEFFGKKIDGWTVGALIGNGASAVVFDAEQNGNKAAVKIFDRELVDRYGEEYQLARIQLELKLVGKHHPNLVRILGGGKCAATGCLYVVMERLYFKPLSARVVDCAVQQIRPIVFQIADAARYLESILLVHRDIKPENIAISDDLSHAILLDFGVLRPLGNTDAGERGSGQEFIATIRYASPEYLTRTEEDSPDGWRALTFYQLGGVLHDLIMHKKLFQEFGPPQTRLTDAVRGVIPVVENSEAPANLLELTRNCLQKNWRLRLQLVGWDDFSQSPPSPFDLKSVKERIRKRRAAIGFSITDEVGEDPQAQTQTILNNAAEFVITSIREMRTRTQDFPPLKITREKAIPSEAKLMVAIGPSESYALKCRLFIFIRIELLDILSSAIRVSAVFRCDEEEAWPQFCKWAVIFAGTVDPNEMPKKLENLFYIALDQAQLNPSQKGVQVPLPQGDEERGKDLVD